MGNDKRQAERDAKGDIGATKSFWEFDDFIYYYGDDYNEDEDKNV